MNRPFGVPALAGRDLPAPGFRQAGRLKAGLQTSGVPTDRFMVPMHAKKRKEAFHKPSEAPPGFGVRQSSGALAMDASRPKAPEHWRSPRRYRAIRRRHFQTASRNITAHHSPLSSPFSRAGFASLDPRFNVRQTQHDHVQFNASICNSRVPASWTRARLFLGLERRIHNLQCFAGRDVS